MNANIEYALELLHSVLYDEPTPVPDENTKWFDILSVLGMGEVFTIVHKKIKELPEEKQPEPGLMKWLQMQCNQMVFEKLCLYDAVTKIIKEAEQRGIQVIVFKGPTLGELYPEPMLRISCDIDLYVEPAKLKEFEQILVEYKFTKNEAHSKETVPVYVFADKFMIEAHCCLFEDHEGPRVDLLKAMDLTNEHRLIKTRACGMEVTTLGYEDHLVFLMFHLIKHVGYSGCSLKTIIDIALFVNAYHDKINKASFWEKMKLLSYDNFARTLFSICVFYFGMTEEIFIDDSYSENVAKSSLERMYETGILKADDVNRKEDRRASSIVYQSIHGKEDKKISKFRMWCKTMFPSHKDLSFRYMYARRHPSLVWLAWIHRAFNQVSVRFIKDKQAVANVSEDMKLANQKLALLKDLDLMNKD